MKKLRQLLAWICLGISFLILISWGVWVGFLFTAGAELAADPATSGIDYLPVYLGLGFGSFASVVFGILFSCLSVLLSRREGVKLLAMILSGIFVAGGFVAVLLIV